MLASDQSLKFILGDHTRIQIRRIRPDDRECLRRGIQRFSRQSTYQRFFTPVVAFSERDLDYLTQVDGVEHLALAALDVSTNDEQGVGVARYIRLEGDPRVAEVAVSVLDAYQGRGIGSLLFALLSRCAAVHGIDVFQADLLGTNRRLLRALVALGAERHSNASGVIQLNMPVYSTPRELPRTPHTRMAYEAWARVDAALASS